MKLILKLFFETNVPNIKIDNDILDMVEAICDKITLKEIKKLFYKLNMNKNIKNRGTGAGGIKTNYNELFYEKLTELNDYLTIIKNNKYSNIIKFHKSENIYIRTKKTHLFKYMDNYTDKKISKAHGCKNPDECYINEKTNTIFIIEKKFQQTSGSVCEKIQTSDFKLWQYNRTFPNYNIIYIYCLSEWFNNNCKAELEYLKLKNIPVFWGYKKTYKNDIIDFIIKHSS